MNAAFLLVTTAWFAGDTSAALPAAGCNTCGATSCATASCDCGGGHKLLDRLHGMFAKKDCCDTCAAPKCPAPAPVCAPKCAPAPCDACSSGPKLLDKLRACFHKEKPCCDTGCATGACSTCGSPATIVAPKAGEPIPAPPKKMPSTGTEPPAKEVRYNNPPSEAPVAPAIEIAPNAGQAAPAAVPSFNSDNLRSPF